MGRGHQKRHIRGKYLVYKNLILEEKPAPRGDAICGVSRDEIRSEHFQEQGEVYHITATLKERRGKEQRRGDGTGKEDGKIMMDAAKLFWYIARSHHL